jgi:transposase
MPRSSRPEYDISLRASIVFMKSPFGGSKSSSDVKKVLGAQAPSIASINRLYKTAIDRGFKPDADHYLMQDQYVVDAPRTGRPTKKTKRAEKVVVDIVSSNRNGREESCVDIAIAASAKLGVPLSPSTVYRILKKAGYTKTKPTRKPGLSSAMRKKRMAFAKDHEDWTLDDWRNVIWSDETSVLLGHRRGGIRVWRRPDEAYEKSVIRERWKGFMEFMFWGCFTYDRKGPCHVWKRETSQQKKAADKDIANMNAAIEKPLREMWEIEHPLSRVVIRDDNHRGPKPKFIFDKAHGKLTRGGKGGIDWYRYQKVIMVPKMIPFAKQCLVNRPNTIVQEDNAPCHAAAANSTIYQLSGIVRMLWPGNSPDLNAIEPLWYYMKVETTRKGPPTTAKEAEARWLKCWRDVPQSKLQALVERIPHHISEIIRLKGGNEYPEGRPPKFDRRQALKQPSGRVVVEVEVENDGNMGRNLRDYFRQQHDSAEGLSDDEGSDNWITF